MANRRTVGDFVSLQRGTTYKGVLVGKPGPALLGLGSIRPGGGFRDGDYKTYGGDCPPKLMLSPGDLFVSLKGATKDGEMIGSIARVPTTVSSGRLTQDTVKLVFHERNQADQEYIYWVLRSPQYRAYCAGRATGSAVVALSREDFLAYPVPPVDAEKLCAVRLLEAVEKQTELNRKTNETLEAMARALFQSWFVDFHPVRAKSKGHNPTLPAHVADLLPSRLADPRRGPIPAGWTVGTLLDCASLNPESWSKQTRPQSIQYVDLSNVKWGRIEERVEYASSDAPSRAQRVLKPGDTIIGTVRPGNGSFALISENGLTGSTGFAVLRPKESTYTEFLYLAATAPENIDRLAHIADGGAYPAVRPEVVISQPVVLPSKDVMSCFSKMCAPLLRLMAQNERESICLTAMRDSFLPKLISGELRVNNIAGGISWGKEVHHGH